MAPFIFVVCFLALSRRAGSVTPCDPKASSEVREVLKILQDTQAAGRIITGQVESDQHDDEAGGSKTFTRRDWDTVYNITGQHPGMWGGQFLWGSPTWAHTYRQEMVERAIDLWTSTEGRVLTHINFHLCPPTAKYKNRTCTWNDIEGSGKNPPSLGEAMLTDGTDENAIWLADLDMMAGFLQMLQARRVPVLWRPFHEANGGWFWWGQQPQFKALWKQMYDHFTIRHELHNLLWVYGPSGQFPIGPMYPGPDMVDILGQDIYAKSAGVGGFSAAAYHDLTTTANGKPVAFTEIGLAPNEDVLSSQNHSYCLMWGGFEKNTNSPEELRALYKNTRAVNQGQLFTHRNKLQLVI